MSGRRREYKTTANAGSVEKETFFSTIPKLHQHFSVRDTLITYTWAFSFYFFCYEFLIVENKHRLTPIWKILKLSIYTKNQVNAFFTLPVTQNSLYSKNQVVIEKISRKISSRKISIVTSWIRDALMLVLYYRWLAIIFFVVETAIKSTIYTYP